MQIPVQFPWQQNLRDIATTGGGGIECLMTMYEVVFLVAGRQAVWSMTTHSVYDQECVLLYRQPNDI